MFLEGLLLIILALLSALTLRWYYIFWTYKNCLKHFPTTAQIPLLGATYKIRNTEDVYSVLLSNSKTLGRNIFAMMGFMPTLFTSDPKMFALILGSSKHINKPPIFKTLELATGDSLFLVNGNEWKHQRKLLNPAFVYANVISNISAFNTHSDNLINILADKVNKKDIDVTSLIEDWSISQVYETMIDSAEDLKGKWEFLEAVKLLMKIGMERMIKINEYYSLTYVFTKNYWLEKKMAKITFDHTRRIIEMKKSKINSEGIQKERPILIDILVKQMGVDANITEASIARQLCLIIGAGYDTSVSAISFALYNLSLFPTVQRKVYEEVVSILGDNIQQHITHEHIGCMTYLELVIKESMRIKTSAPVFSRKIDEDIDFEGTTLPKGLVIVMMPFVMHLDSDLYPEPEKFIPERFLQENLNPNKYSYAPFSLGVRNCIGQKHAMLSMKVVLAKILLNYELISVQQELRLSSELTLRSTTGVKVTFRPRRPLSK